MYGECGKWVPTWEERELEVERPTNSATRQTMLSRLITWLEKCGCLHWFSRLKTQKQKRNYMMCWKARQKETRDLQCHSAENPKVPTVSFIYIHSKVFSAPPWPFPNPPIKPCWNLSGRFCVILLITWPTNRSENITSLLKATPMEK